MPAVGQQGANYDSLSDIVVTSNFAHGSDGWLPVFTDYNLDESGFDFLAERRSLPASVEVPFDFRKAYYLQSHNRSDDVFMFLKKVLTAHHGVIPNAAYYLNFEILFASNAADCIGSGGSPGESVYLKAGGSSYEPVPDLLPTRYISITIEKGNQSEGGRQMGAVSNIANGGSCDEPTYVLLRKHYRHPFPIHSSPSGQLWIAVGTDSGYEGLTGIYYYQIRVQLSRA